MVERAADQQGLIQSEPGTVNQLGAGSFKGIFCSKAAQGPLSGKLCGISSGQPPQQRGERGARRVLKQQRREQVAAQLQVLHKLVSHPSIPSSRRTRSRETNLLFESGVQGPLLRPLQPASRLLQQDIPHTQQAALPSPTSISSRILEHKLQTLQAQAELHHVEGQAGNERGEKQRASPDEGFVLEEPEGCSDRCQQGHKH